LHHHKKEGLLPGSMLIVKQGYAALDSCLIFMPFPASFHPPVTFIFWEFPQWSRQLMPQWMCSYFSYIKRRVLEVLACSSRSMFKCYLLTFSESPFSTFSSSDSLCHSFALTF
jgi:hypothetical protein